MIARSNNVLLGTGWSTYTQKTPREFKITSGFSQITSKTIKQTNKFLVFVNKNKNKKGNELVKHLMLLTDIDMGVLNPMESNS